MSLQSQLLRGDLKLERAAVSDPAHILPGTKGSHVGKIQQALIQLDDAEIEADESYGPATAAAVLAYKQKRNIINTARQSQADNVVGKMTIASLDREMLASERAFSEPVRIRPLVPAAGGVPSADSLRRRPFLLGFAIDVDIPDAPGPLVKNRERYLIH